MSKLDKWLNDNVEFADEGKAPRRTIKKREAVTLPGPTVELITDAEWDEIEKRGN